MNIILDFEKKRILIHKEVTDAVGSITDFGLWHSKGYAEFLITRDNPIKPSRARNIGRKPKHRGNMNIYDASEQAFEHDMSPKINTLLKTLGLESKFNGRVIIFGKMVAETTAAFDLTDAIELLQDQDLAKYKVISRSMFIQPDSIEA